MLQDVQPFIVTVVREPARNTTLRDLFLGSLGITGLLILTAVVLGAVVALGLILWNRSHPPEADHLPSVAPLTRAPSSQPR